MAGGAGLPAAPDPGAVCGPAHRRDDRPPRSNPGSYDDTLIVVVADHGVSVRPGQHPRRITPETGGRHRLRTVLLCTPVVRRRAASTTIGRSRLTLSPLSPTSSGSTSSGRWTGLLSSLPTAHNETKAPWRVSRRSPSQHGYRRDTRRRPLPPSVLRRPRSLRPCPLGKGRLLGRMFLAVTDYPSVRLLLDHPEWYAEMAPCSRSPPRSSERSGHRCRRRQDHLGRGPQWADRRRNPELDRSATTSGLWR